MTFVLQILGAVALMLWGLRMVRNGVMAAYGPSIKSLARDSEKKRLAPFFSGLIAAVALQSSTATAMIAASFASKKTIGTLTAFVIILGADLGTAVAAIIASQKIAALSPTLIAVGVFGYLNSEATKPRGIFRAIGGVGFVLLALTLIKSTTLDLASSDGASTIIAAVLGLPFMAVVAGVVLTYLAHSSLAVVLLTVSSLAGGLIDVDAAVYLVVGANIGSGLLPFIANLQARREARLAVTANLALRCLGAGGLYYAWKLIPIFPEIALVPLPLQLHLILNIVVALIGMATAPLVLRLVSPLVANDQDGDNRIQTRFLDNQVIKEPTKALALAKREALAMAEIAQEMVERSRAVLEGAPSETDKEVSTLEDGLDRLFDSIKLYVARVLQQPLSEEQTRQAMDVLSFTANMEHVGDIVDGNLMSLAARKRALNTQFSEVGNSEISTLFDSILENFGLAVNTFLTEDRDLARQLFNSKTDIRELQQKFMASHMERLGSGASETVRTSSLHIDLIRDLKRINSHLTAVAYSVLRASGEVPKTKWKKAPAGTVRQNEVETGRVVS